MKRTIYTVHENNDRLVLSFYEDTRFCVYHRGERTRIDKPREFISRIHEQTFIKAALLSSITSINFRHPRFLMKIVTK